jgi:hypothetical protein
VEGRIQSYTIPATRADGRSCRLVVHDEYAVHDSANARVGAKVFTRVVTEDGEFLIRVTKGKYRHPLSGEKFVSDDPKAPE